MKTRVEQSLSAQYLRRVQAFRSGLIGRRDFLAISGAALAGLLGSAVVLGCGKPSLQLPPSPTLVEPDRASAGGPLEDRPPLVEPLEDRPPLVEPLELSLPPAPRGAALVALVRAGDVEAAVHKAIALAGGLDEIRPGQRVVIKPNLTGVGGNGRIYTSPEVIRAVIRAVKERTAASNITVAEASAFNLSTREWAKSSGVLSVIEEEGANFLAWEKEPYLRAWSQHFKNIPFELQVPRSLFDGSFAHFINLPILKNHEMVAGSNVDYTCCIKNHVGVIHPNNRFSGGKGIHEADLGERCAELVLAVPRHAMNVVDGLSIVLSGGPAASNMQIADAGLILASKDPVACDSLAVAVLKRYARKLGIDRPYVNKSVWAQAQIQRALQLNLGRPAGLCQVVAEGVDDAAEILAEWR